MGIRFSKTKNIKFILLSALAVLILVELGLRVFSSSWKDDVKRVAADPAEGLSQGMEQRILRHINKNLRQPESGKFIPHPYFGMVYNWSEAPNINRDGFFNSIDFNSVKNNDERFVIGIFGGSLAEDFAIFQQTQTERKSVLADKLRERIKALTDKEVIVLNFSIKTAKQPQQFFISSVYSDKLDLAITIDGYNEISTPPAMEFPLEFPYFSFLFFSKDPERNKYIQETYSKLNSRSDFAQLLVPLSQFYLINHLWRIIDKTIASRITHLQSGFRAMVDSQFPYFEEPLSDETVLQERVKIWKKYTQAQSLLLSANQIQSFHFLQPNQHVRNSKPLTAEEKNSFLEPNRVDEITKAYSSLRGEVSALRAKNINIFDFSDIYSKIEETVYRDSCCHLNDTGMTILEDRIVEKIGESFVVPNQKDF